MVLCADNSGRFLQNPREVAQILRGQNEQSMRVEGSDPQTQLELYILQVVVCARSGQDLESGQRCLPFREGGGGQRCHGNVLKMGSMLPQEGF